MLEEVREIWRATSVQGFVGQGGKVYTPFNRKPMELFAKFIWREWRCMRMLVLVNPSHCTIDLLKASCVLQ